jgi:hypothetical protein
MLPYNPVQQQQQYACVVAQTEDLNFTVTVTMTGIVLGYPAPAAQVYTFATEAAAQAFAAAVALSAAAAAEWVVGARQVMRQFETLMTEASRLEVVYIDNQLFDLVTATLAATAGDGVPGMGVSALRSVAIGALMQDLKAHLAEDVAGNPPTGMLTGITRRSVISKRD